MAPQVAFKPIQPAPAKRERSGDGSGSGIRSMSGSVLSGITSSDRPTKRLKAVTQACHTCRKFKARCDGARPRCGGCAAKGKPCGYEGEEGQSRQAAMKSRLEALEKLVGALQSKSPEEAEELLQRIRSADDIVSLSALDGEVSGSGAPSVISRSSSASQSSRMPRNTMASSRLSSSISESSDPSSTSSATIATPTSSTGVPFRVGADTSPYLIGFLLPSAQSTLAGVQSFYSSSGKLFHVFSQPQIHDFHKTVYGYDGKPNKSQKVAICCMCIVAAIGVQYNPGDFEQGSDEALYEVAHHLFAAVVEDSPLDAIKVCTLMAMYNVMNKATAALAYVETGLSLSKRQSLNTGVCHPSQLSAADWKDFRRTWRTLIFFSSWLSSTLGYISGNGESTSAFEKLVPLANADYDNYNEVAEMVQSEMTKIALLKAGILKTHLANKELTVYGMNGIIKELQEWHERLPPQMQLAKLGDFDLAPGIRWSIYHVHLLYLGAYMLVYRRIAAQCVREYREGEKFVLANDDSTLVSLVEQGVTAARDSARILGLLHADRGIFQRCWLVIFQAHTSCVVILHSVAQKQLHNFPPSSWADDMKQAQNCLDVLGFCSEKDPVALRFRIKLKGIYDALVDSGSRGKTNRQRIEEWVPLPPALSRCGVAGENSLALPFTPPKVVADYLLTVPPDADQDLLKLSFTLLQALCKPWGEGDSSAVDKAELAVCDTLGAGKAPPTAGFVTLPKKGVVRSGGADRQSSNSRTLPNLDWDLEKHSPFKWDTVTMTGTNMADAWFLGSEAPNGWSPAVDIEEIDDSY